MTTIYIVKNDFANQRIVASILIRDYAAAITMIIVSAILVDFSQHDERIDFDWLLEVNM